MNKQKLSFGALALLWIFTARTVSADTPMPPNLEPAVTIKVAEGVDTRGVCRPTVCCWRPPSRGKSCGVWDIATGKVKVESDQNVTASQLIWATDGATLIACSRDGGITVVDAATGVVQKLEGSEKMKLIAGRVRRQDGGCRRQRWTVTIWDLKAGKAAGTLKGTGRDRIAEPGEGRRHPGGAGQRRWFPIGDDHPLEHQVPQRC